MVVSIEPFSRPPPPPAQCWGAQLPFPPPTHALENPTSTGEGCGPTMLRCGFPDLWYGAAAAPFLPQPRPGLAGFAHCSAVCPNNKPCVAPETRMSCHAPATSEVLPSGRKVRHRGGSRLPNVYTDKTESSRLPPNRRQLPPNRRRLPPNRRQLPPNRRRLPPNHLRLSPNHHRLTPNGAPSPIPVPVGQSEDNERMSLRTAQRSGMAEG